MQSLSRSRGQHHPQNDFCERKDDDLLDALDQAHRPGSSTCIGSQKWDDIRRRRARCGKFRTSAAARLRQMVMRERDESG
jgi:hypothetical protein